MTTLLIITTWPVTKPEGTGISTFYRVLSTGLERNGCNITLWNPDICSGNYFLQTLQRIRANFSLNRFLRKNVFDTVFTLDYDGFCMRPTGSLRVGTSRGIFIEIAPTESGLYRIFLYLQAWLERINLHKSDIIIVPSRYAERCLRDKYNVTKEIIVIPNGIDLDQWDKAGGQEDPVFAGSSYILSVAQFYPRKKIPLLIQAFEGVVKTVPGIKLVLVGDGFELKRCKDLAHRLNIEDKINFTGLIRDRDRIASFFKHCLVFCHSSHQETFGNVLLEAMASVKPVVAVNVCAVPEIVTHNENGILVPPDDVLKLQDALIHLMQDPCLRDRLALNARKTAEQYSITTMIRKYSRVLNRRM